jgi:hypothetical protein
MTAEWVRPSLPVKVPPARTATFGEKLEDLALHFEHLAAYWNAEGVWERGDAYHRAAFLLWEVIND